MPAEIATTISGLAAANPTGTEPVSEGDDHLRLIKSVLKSQFPGAASGGTGLTAPIRVTAAEMNRLSGVTSPIQTQLQTLTAADTAQKIQLYAPVGTQMLFYQSAAPTGWTAQTEDANRMLIVSPFGGNLQGGTMDALNITLNHAHTNTPVALTIAQMPAHTHTEEGVTSVGDQGSGGSAVHGSVTQNTGSQGGNATHTHGMSLALNDWAPRFMSYLRCRKN